MKYMKIYDNLPDQYHQPFFSEWGEEGRVENP